MDDDVAVRAVIDKLLPERLWRLRQVSGVPVAFGGPVAAGDIVLTRAYGTLGDSLRGVRVAPGHGLGGVVLRDGGPGYVSDYATATTITHDFDDIIVAGERLTSVFALPVTVRGAVRGVLYGAVRGPAPLGDRAIRAASVVASQLQRDITRQLTQSGDGTIRDEAAPDDVGWEVMGGSGTARDEATGDGTTWSGAALGSAAWGGTGPGSAGRQDAETALAELARLIPAVGDLEVRDRLARVYRALAGPRRALPAAGTSGAGGASGPASCSRAPASRPADGGPAPRPAAVAMLAPRERDVLRIASVGASNLEIAAQLGLSPQTVKAYMRAAMRKLGVHNRTAALHAARLADAL